MGYLPFNLCNMDTDTELVDGSALLFEVEKAKPMLNDILVSPEASPDPDALTQVLLWLRQLQNGPPQEFAKALQVLADRSRWEDWREPIGESGLLAFCMDTIASSNDLDVHVQALRLIANTCADRDGNRQRVISHPRLAIILEELSFGPTVYAALTILLNVSLDYEPAQKALKDKNICLALIKLLLGPLSANISLDQICDLFWFAIEAYDVSQSPDTIITRLLDISTAVNVDIDVFVCISNVLAVHLKNDHFQKVLLEHDYFVRFLGSILRTVSFQPDSCYSLNPEDYPPTEDIAQDEAERLESLGNLLTVAASDVCSNGAFPDKYSYPSKLASDLISWLQLGRPQLQILACRILSNVVRVKPSCGWSMVQAPDSVHLHLIGMLHCPDSHTCYVALEFLLQLARQIDNRVTVCQQPLLQAMIELWTRDDYRTHYASITVLRELIKDCPQAVKQLLATSLTSRVDLALREGMDQPLIAQRRPASTSDHQHYGINSEETDYDRRGTFFSTVLYVFDNTSNVNVKSEVAKLVVEVCRCLPGLGKDDRTVLLHHETFIVPIAWMVSQANDPGLLSQGYLSLVLILRYCEDGIVYVNQVLQRANVFNVLTKVLAGQTITPETETEKTGPLQRSVNENARWLIMAVLEAQAVTLPSGWTAILRQLLHGDYEEVENVMERAKSYLVPS